MQGSSNQWRRRPASVFLAWLSLVLFGVLLSPALAADPGAGVDRPAETELPMTGPAVPELAPFDRIVTELMRKWEIPGGAVAVTKDGKLLLARGYGLADVDQKTPVEPDSLFRIASVSKPITGAACLVLVQQGRLELDAKVVDVLSDVKPLPGESMDPRLREVTVRQLLHHTAGFDRIASFDPMFRPQRIAEAAGETPPAGPAAILRYMWGRPLDFDPGTRYAYSNFGYCVLGRVIEKITGQSYEEALKRLVLEPAGIRRMRLGRTRIEDRAPGEVRYYTSRGDLLCRSVFPEVHQRVPAPYGRFYLEAMDAHGGWIASAVDLVRFANAVSCGAAVPPAQRSGDSPTTTGFSAILKPAILQMIAAPPEPNVSKGKPAYYGLGWEIRPAGDGANWFHFGSLPGTSSLLVRTHDGMTWAALFNSRPRNADRFYRELDQAIWRAVREVQRWPQRDLFSQFP